MPALDQREKSSRRETRDAFKRNRPSADSLFGRLNEYAGPGHWNDPDYILIGRVGNAFRIDAPPAPTTLTPDEQYSYMSMWALMAAPLIFCGDMDYLDDFTLNVLCNSEVIAVDQDPLGKQGCLIRRTDDEFVLAKPMADGSLAVGLFNLSDGRRDVAVTLSELGLAGSYRVRDLWRQKDAGECRGRHTATVNRHGVSLVSVVCGEGWSPELISCAQAAGSCRNASSVRRGQQRSTELCNRGVAYSGGAA